MRRLIPALHYRAATVAALLILITTTTASALFKPEDKAVRDVDVTLSYHLTLDGSKKTVFNLTSLIPQTIKGKQEITKLMFSPEPKRTYEQNGNMYAEWKYSGNKIPRVFEIRLRVRMYQQTLKNKVKPEKLYKKDRLKYLKREKYIDVKSRIIINALKKIPKGKSEIEYIYNITKFVTKLMKPDKASREMLGASKALKKKTGDCTEYTDLLVTLLRQAGFPARHVSGYILNFGGGEGHSWVEVYTKSRGWMTVDPLHIDLKRGTFKSHMNKYIAFSSIRNDPVLKGGMIYGWGIFDSSGKTKGAKLLPRIKYEDHKVK